MSFFSSSTSSFIMEGMVQIRVIWVPFDQESSHRVEGSNVNAAISLCPVPRPLRKVEVTSVLCLEVSSLNQQVTVRPMGLFSGDILRKYLLDVMIALVPGALDPHPFCLI